MATSIGAAAAPKGRTQIPIVCPGHTRPLAELQFCTVHENGITETFLVSACHDKMPMMRDAQSGDWIGTFVGHKGAVWSCRLDPAGYLAATASGDFSVKVWDAITGGVLYSFPHKHIVKSVDFSPNSTRLATGGHEGILRIYNLHPQPQQQKEGQDAADPLTIVQRTDKTVIITKCAWLNDEVVLAACSDGGIRFWDVGSDHAPQLIHTLSVGTEIRDMELSGSSSNDDNNILTVAAGEEVYFFDLSPSSSAAAKLVQKHTMPIHFRNEGGASLHPSGTKFVAGGSDLWVRVFDFETGEELECHKGHHGPVRCVRYSPDGNTYATGSEDGTIRLWKTDP